ncbi:hypothetical protein ACFPQ1_10510 [Rhodocytophaga aerolata]
MLLSIQLIPHYLILAALVIVAHWIWIFGIKKGRHQSKITTKGYQTGGSYSNSSSQYNADQEALIISRPSLPEQFLVNKFSGSTHEALNATSSDELVASQIPAEEQEDTHYLGELTQKQADFDIVSAIKALAEEELDADGFKTLQEIATITVATDKQYPDVVEEIKDILTSPADGSKDIPFII